MNTDLHKFLVYVFFLTTCMHAESCLTLCDPMDCSPPGSSVHGILQARILEWAAISSSRGSFQPRDRMCLLCLLHWQANSLPLSHLGIPTTQAVCDRKAPFKCKGQLTGKKQKTKLVWGRDSLVGFNCVPTKKKKKDMLES